MTFIGSFNQFYAMENLTLSQQFLETKKKDCPWRTCYDYGSFSYHGYYESREVLWKLRNCYIFKYKSAKLLLLRYF